MKSNLLLIQTLFQIDFITKSFLFFFRYQAGVNQNKDEFKLIFF